jgi:hypothetical protein
MREPSVSLRRRPLRSDDTEGKQLDHLETTGDTPAPTLLRVALWGPQEEPAKGIQSLEVLCRNHGPWLLLLAGRSLRRKKLKCGCLGNGDHVASKGERISSNGSGHRLHCWSGRQYLTADAGSMHAVDAESEKPHGPSTRWG